MAPFIFFVIVIFLIALFAMFPYLSYLGRKIERQTYQKQISKSHKRVKFGEPKYEEDSFHEQESIRRN